MSFPYLAKTTLKYKSPHATDLSFAKDETIRVTGPSEDDEDWLVGEYLDGSKSGGFPKDFIVPIEESEPGKSTSQPEASEAPIPKIVSEDDNSTETEALPPVSINEPAPPSPKLDPQSRLPTPAIAPSPVPPASPAPQASTTVPTTSAPSAPTPAPAPASTGDSPPRPQSMKDRLAFFAAAQNKPAPPPIKPKPQTGGLTWSQRQKLRQEQEAKERESNPNPTPPTSQPASAPEAPAAPVSTGISVPAQKEGNGTEEGKGMSAADALSSITKGGSLKERMAALQGQGAFGGGGGDEEKKSVPPPVSSGKVWKRPPAPPQPEPEIEVEGEARTEEGSDITSQAEKVKSPIAEEGDSLAQAGEQGEAGEEEDEEEKEKARRAAIAARMAKLGARGPMGMMPPAKPARKPTREAVPTTAPAVAEEEKAGIVAPSAVPAFEPAADDGMKEDLVSQEPGSLASPAPAEPTPSDIPPTTAPPKSIPIAAMPRRTAPPRRRGPTSSAAPSTASPEVVRENPAEPEKRFETTDENGAPVPPPQVMVAGEEDTLPKTELGMQKEKEAEEVGKGVGGLEGAAAAGIALAPVDPPTSAQPQEEQEKKNAPLEPEMPEEKDEPLVGAVAGADSISRGTGAIATQEGEGEIIDNSQPVQEVEEGIVEGGDEKDDILKEAEQGKLDFKQPNDPLDEVEGQTPLSPVPIGMVPLHPPASDGSDYDEDEPNPPPPPPRRPRGFSMDNIPLDEVELKHEHDHTHGTEHTPSEHPIQEDEDDEASPPPLPSQRRVSTDKPAGPRPLPSSAKEGRALPPPPVGSSLIPPREDSDDEAQDEEDGDEAPPPPPPGRHVPPPIQPEEEDDAEEEEEEEEDDVPPPLPSARHLPPVPTQRSEEAESVPPPPPARLPPAPVEADAEEQEAPPPPPPARKPSLPAPLQIGVPTPAGAPKSPSAPSPAISSSPVRSRTLATPDEAPLSPKEEDEDATRRSGIAARMAKLGGIKFGMPPPTFKKPAQNVTSPTTEAPTFEEGHIVSPIDKEPPLPSPRSEQAAAPIQSAGDEVGEETAEQEAARRRATLARLRAGGALGGFGLFNQGGPPAEVEEPKEDQRGLQSDVHDRAEAEDEDAEAPPPPPGRPAVPSARPILGPPATANVQEEEDAPPPPPPIGRPTISTSVGEDAPAPPPRVPQAPTSPMPASPVRTPSGRRPPIPAEKRFSSSSHRRTNTSSSAIIPEDRPTSIASDWQITNEPAVMYSNQIGNEEEGNDAPPPPPPNRPPPPPSPRQAQGEIPPQSPIRETPRRSGSLLSGKSRTSIDIPPSSPSRMYSQQQEIPSSPVQGTLARQPSVSQAQSQAQQGGRPGFDQLKEASTTYGAQLARSAHSIFSQGRRAQVGDGSPAGFVLFAMDQAKLPRPAQGWGQIIFEQEGGSILRKYDAPRPGDIAAFHDSKLKGKKGLTTYNQHVGSVEEPLIGVVAEFEERKHKLRILQVERGIPEEVSYRCEDLKSGKIIVYRAGL